MTVYGFTGTRAGMSHPQRQALGKLLSGGGVDTLHHGDDKGADTDAHFLAASYGIYIVVHPPTNTSRSYGHGGKEVREPKPYLTRNHAIVDESDVLIAAPDRLDERARSGTWATIRYARKAGKPVIILDP